jgi:(2Fe-2S) ferredoxin
MVIYPEGVWYTYSSIEDVEEIIQRHLLKGERVERLMLQPEDKLPADREAREAAQSRTAQ